jgi:predicted nucleotidyltransferase
MDVSHPILAVSPGLTGPVLGVLARTNRALTGREVHRLARIGSEAGVRRVLNRLVDHGLAVATQAGQAVLYVANREHLAWPAVMVLTTLRETLLDALRTEIGSWSVPPVAAALFGSTARGDGDTHSDVDLLVVRPEFGATQGARIMWDDQLARLRDRVYTWTGNRAQIYEVDVGEVAAHVHTGAPVLDEWRRDAITLAGPPIQKIIRSVRQEAQ